MLLDKCHEELKSFYLAQPMPSKQSVNDDGWSTQKSGKAPKERFVQENKDEIMESSIVRDIFGGELRTEFIVESTKKVDVIHEPFYVLNLEIPRDCYTL
jgi:hypothetical protein